MIKRLLALLKVCCALDVLPRRSLIEMVTSTLGVLLSIVAIVWIGRWWLEGDDVPLLVASMGAAAVLLFAAPRSTMSQPWPLLGGHIISATVGVTCALYIPDMMWAAALAVSGAVFAMHLTRSLHPPGGAAALVAVVGGDSIQSLGYAYVAVPVALNAFVMLLVALLLYSLLPGERIYPGVVQGQDQQN